MPTIAFKSKVKSASEHCILSLNIRHRLLLGQPSDLVFDVKPTVPEAVDVLLFSNLTITVSGSLDGTRITPAALKASHIANHLVDFLQTNAEELGINAVSELYISEDTGLLSLTLTASRCFPASSDVLPVHLKLMALDLDYVWKTNPNATTPGQLDAAINPFARHLSLPYLFATDNAVGRFVTFHLVRRYPLIFGPWCKQLDAECSFFPPIFTSIQRIIERSHSPVFQATCQKLFKLFNREIMSASIPTAGALLKYLGSEVGTYSPPVIYTYNEEEAFYLCLERFYRVGMKRPKFRHLSVFPTITTGSSEDLLSDSLVTLNPFGVGCPSDQSPKTSGLRPHVSLFEGTYMDRSSELEFNTEDDHHVIPPSNSYQNNNTPQESLDQIWHLIDIPFDAKGAEMSDQDSCDDIYNLFQDEVGSRCTFEQRFLNKIDPSNDDPADLAVDSDIDYLPEESDAAWKISNHRDCSTNSLSFQGYEQEPLGEVMAQQLKMPTPLLLDPLHIGYGPTLRSLVKTEDIAQTCLVSQESSSDDYNFELDSDMQIALTPNLVLKSMITDGDDHGIVAFNFVPKSSQVQFSDQHSRQPMCEYEEDPAVGGGIITERFLIIEYDSA